MTDTKPDSSETASPVRRHTRWMIAMILITMVAFFMGFPVFYLALITAPAAIVFGIMALVASKGQSDMLPIRINVIVGMVLAGFGMVIALFGLLVYDVLAELQECEARAVTQTAERACAEDYQQNYVEFFEQYGISIPDDALSLTR